MAVYLDHSATTPLHSEVLEAMLPYLRTHHGNPGSLHRSGRQARRAVDRARSQVAQLIHADASEIYFTSGGTETNHWLLTHLNNSSPSERVNVCCPETEHHSVLNCLATQSEATAEGPIRLPVDSNGSTAPAGFPEHLAKSIRLISIQWANNETGQLHPLTAWLERCQAMGIPMHSDAVQAAGKLPINLETLPLSALTLSAHKLGGPKGIGAAFIRRGIAVDPLFAGGAQERGHRAGTENVAGIVGFGTACERARRNLDHFTTHIAALRNTLEVGILEKIPETWLNGSPTNRAPHIANLGFKGLEGEAITMALDNIDIAVSTGSACSSGSVDPSHVLLAMGQDHTTAHAAVRFSLGWDTTEEDVEQVLAKLPPLIESLRSQAGGTPS